MHLIETVKCGWHCSSLVCRICQGPAEMLSGKASRITYPLAPLRPAGESSMGLGFSRTLENSLRHVTGCMLSKVWWTFCSTVGLPFSPQMWGEVDGQGTGHAQKTMSNYLGTSGSNFLWLQKLFFVPPARAHSRMTCRSRRHNYMEMVFCSGTSQNQPLYTGRGRQRAASVGPKLGVACFLMTLEGLFLFWLWDSCLNVTQKKQQCLPCAVVMSTSIGSRSDAYLLCDLGQVT